MVDIKSRNHKHEVIAQYAIGAILLLCGCCIYLMFRSKSITLYHWVEHVGLSNLLCEWRNSVQDWEVPVFVLYSLPDGLYCASYIIVMNAAWPKTSNRLVKLIAVSAIPCVALIHELLQTIGYAKGTFDVYDLLSYSVPLIIYYSLTFYQQLKNQKQ